ncbi:fibronectin type III domain protein [Flavobacteriaceae bacterium MAR_2009_75]|nr:fibronectin type III domain protein [Flavobacteriaceae bacterium MAR_2009_75]
MKERPFFGLLSLTLILLSILFFAACEKDEEVVPESVVKPDRVAPEPPRELIATDITDSSAVVSWQKAKDNIKVKDYVVFRDSTEVFRDTVTTYLANKLEPDTSYMFSVRATDEAGNISDFSEAVEIVTKAADTIDIDSLNPYSLILLRPKLELDSVSSTSVDLSWKSESSSSAIEEYRIYQDSTHLVSLVKNYYSIDNLTPEKAYSFWVVAVDAADKETKPSNVIDVLTLAEEQKDTIAPPAPTGLKFDGVTTHTIDLSWQPSADSLEVVVYSIYSDTLLLTTTEENAFQIQDLEPNTEYNFSVTAWDEAENESKPSDILSVKTEKEDEIDNDSLSPGPPINLKIIEVTSDIVHFEWESASDSTKVSEYRIYQDEVLVGSTTQMEFQVSELIANTEYHFAVATVDDKDQESDLSESLVVTTEAHEERPVPNSIPVNLSASEITLTSLELSWETDKDSLSSTEFKVYQDGTFFATVSESRIEVSGLSPNSEYSFSVSTIDENNNESERSNPLTVSTKEEDKPAIDTTAPSVPNDLVAGEVTETSIDLSWSPSTDSVGVTGYKIYQNESFIASVKEVNYRVDGLANGTEYSFSVSAFDAAENESELSEALIVSTRKEVVVDDTPPSVPQNLSVQETTQTTVSLVWEPASDDFGVSGYIIYQDGESILTTTSTAYQVTALTPQTTYRYKVSAFDEENNESGQSLGVSALTLKEEPQETSDKILVFTKTAAFRHGSIEKGVATFQALGQTNDFEVVQTENSGDFNITNLAQYKVVVFLNTTGDVLNNTQQAAFENYIQSGGSFMGVHAATDTEYDWPWYGELVGAYFNGHPSIQEATLNVVDQNHRSTTHLPSTWTRSEEWYNFKDIYSGIIPLVMLDESSYNGGTNGENHPFSWYHEFDGGKSFYTGGGHSNSSYDEPEFRQHLLGGLFYCLGR